MARTFTATLPNGGTATRTSKNRVYTHVIVGRHDHWKRGPQDAFTAITWCGSLPLAEKQLRTQQGKRYDIYVDGRYTKNAGRPVWLDVTLLPVEG